MVIYGLWNVITWPLVGDNGEAELEVEANPPPPPPGDKGVVFMVPDRKILYKAGK